MRQPNHIILDFSNNTRVNNYWALVFNDSTLVPYSYKTRYDNNDSVLSTTVEIHSSATNLLRLNLNSNDDTPLKSNTLYNLVNINFLRKEKLYTKLKYSRSPAFDTVSGGAAALFAGLLGFLVSEKFGMELVDSGDFYYLFMYIVFLSFSLSPLLFSTQAEKSILHILGPSSIIFFYKTILLKLLAVLNVKSFTKNSFTK